MDARTIVDKLLEDDPLQSYVTQPTDRNRRELEPMAKEGKTQAKTLTRISREDPKWRQGERIQLPLTSFTQRGDLVTQGKAIGHIGWKSSDRSIIQIDNPSRGLDVDYSKISVPFNATSEAETLVAGNYIVSAVTKIVEPGTSPSSGYFVPVYTLAEA